VKVVADLHAFVCPYVQIGDSAVAQKRVKVAGHDNPSGELAVRWRKAVEVRIRLEFGTRALHQRNRQVSRYGRLTGELLPG